MPRQYEPFVTRLEEDLTVTAYLTLCRRDLQRDSPTRSLPRGARRTSPTLSNLLLATTARPAEEIIIDSFAGGGGASTGIELALARSPHVAINHDDMALALHQANHPDTIHLSNNIWKIDPDQVQAGRPIGLLWASPDCTHHSKAKGGVPIRSEKRNSRDLGWIVVLWARARRPRVIILENVEEWRQWGPLVAGADGQLRPDPERRGETFDEWCRQLRQLGYRIEWRQMRASDFGAPTTRKRLFVIARCDGRPIVWPEPTHGDPKSEAVLSGRLKPWRTAAEIIDWSLRCPSIFMTRDDARAYHRATGVRVNRPLAEATMARIARGVKRYVLDAAEPFIVPVTHAGDYRCNGTSDPLRTQTTAHRGEHALVTPFVTKFRQNSSGHRLDEPLHTVTAAHSETHPGGAVVVPFLVPRYGERPGQEPRSLPIDRPLSAIVPTGNGAQLVTVTIAGEPYVIIDIGMRMLTPRERFLAQGFPPDYRIDIEFDGKPLSREAQGRMVGNSVCPPHAAALVRANCADMARATTP